MSEIADSIPEPQRMPTFLPKEVVHPGLELPTMDQKTKSIVEAFSVTNQQNLWLAEQGYVTAVAVKNVARKVDELCELVKTVQFGPYRLFARAMRHIGTALITALVTYYVTKQMDGKLADPNRGPAATVPGTHP